MEKVDEINECMKLLVSVNKDLRFVVENAELHSDLMSNDAHQIALEVKDSIHDIQQIISLCEKSPEVSEKIDIGHMVPICAQFARRMAQTVRDLKNPNKI